MFGPSRASLHRALERERARNQQRESELINQILYLSGRMWSPPPIADDEEPEEQTEYVSALDMLHDEPDEYRTP